VTDIQSPVENPAGEPSSKRSLLLPAVIVLALIGLALFAMPFLSILFSIVIPPHPPLPSGVSLTRQQNYDYGIDEWWYTSSQDPCAVLDFYRELGAQCTVSPLQCDRAETTTGDFNAVNMVVARCAGAAEFSLFSMSWWVLITRNPANLQAAQLDVWRGINWLTTGSPAATESPE